MSKANPPKPEGGDKRSTAYKNTVAQDDSVSSTTLRDMRAVHSKLTDKQFEAHTVQVIGSIDPDALKIPARRAASSPPGALALPFGLNRYRFMSNTPGC